MLNHNLECGLLADNLAGIFKVSKGVEKCGKGWHAHVLAHTANSPPPQPTHLWRRPVIVLPTQHQLLDAQLLLGEGGEGVDERVQGQLVGGTKIHPAARLEAAGET